MKTKQYERGQYNEILLDKLSSRNRSIVQNLVDGATQAQKIDEHGSWSFGAEFSRHEGYAINWSLYDHSLDIHSKRHLIILQIRMYTKNRYGGKLQKAYFLVGRNEDDTVFAHSVSGRIVNNAIKKGEDIILKVQKWIFGGVDYERVIRQGDIALVPKRADTLLKKAEGTHESREILLQDSHRLTCDALVQTENQAYTWNPFLVHLNNTHPDIGGCGWFKVLVGKRAPHYSFAAPTID